jgi:hypothetical protein
MTKLSQSLREMTFAVNVLDQENLANPDHSRFTIARGDAVRRIQIDDILSAGRWMPIEEPIRRGGAEYDSCRRKSL